MCVMFVQETLNGDMSMVALGMVGNLDPMWGEDNNTNTAYL